MREQRVILEDEADIAAVRRLVVEALAAQPDRAFAEALEASDAAQGRGLAAAAWPQERKELAGMDLEGNWPDRHLRRIPLTEAADLEFDAVGHLGAAGRLGAEDFLVPTVEILRFVRVHLLVVDRDDVLFPVGRKGVALQLDRQLRLAVRRRIEEALRHHHLVLAIQRVVAEAV